jgi:hypothetical protein
MELCHLSRLYLMRQDDDYELVMCKGMNGGSGRVPHGASPSFAYWHKACVSKAVFCHVDSRHNTVVEVKSSTLKMTVFRVFRRIVWEKFTNVSEQLLTSIIKVLMIWNVGKLIPVYTALQPRRQPSSYSPPWEHQKSEFFIGLHRVTDCQTVPFSICVGLTCRKDTERNYHLFGVFRPAALKFKEQREVGLHFNYTNSLTHFFMSSFFFSYISFISIFNFSFLCFLFLCLLLPYSSIANFNQTGTPLVPSNFPLLLFVNSIPCSC